MGKWLPSSWPQISSCLTKSRQREMSVLKSPFNFPLSRPMGECRAHAANFHRKGNNYRLIVSCCQSSPVLCRKGNNTALFSLIHWLSQKDISVSPWGDAFAMEDGIVHTTCHFLSLARLQHKAYNIFHFFLDASGYTKQDTAHCSSGHVQGYSYSFQLEKLTICTKCCLQSLQLSF